MTRERLVQGILQSVATVAFLPQVRPVIELLPLLRRKLTWLINQSLWYRTLSIIMERDPPTYEERLYLQNALLRHLDGDDHHPRDENGELTQPWARTFVGIETGGPYGPYGSREYDQ